jgi:aminopeptidase YwaD
MAGPAMKRPKVDRDRLWNHERMLCEEIGPRLTGTAADERTVQYVAEHFRRCGAEVEVQDYPCPSWEHESTELALLHGGGTERLPAFAQTFGEACDVEAELVPIAAVEELDFAPDLEGKVLVLHGRLSTVLALDRNRVLMSAEDRRPAALVLVSSTEPVSTKLVRDPFLRVPAAAVPLSLGPKLIENAGARLRLRIRARRYASTGHNVIGRFPGEGGSVVVPAHCDTAAESPGAADNASGTAAVLELCELFSAADRRAVGMTFVAYDAEEYGRHTGANLGAVEYVRRHADEARHGLAVVEPDCIGTAALPPKAGVMGWTGRRKEGLLEVFRRFPRYIVEVGPDDEPAHTAFHLPGIPAVWFVNDYGKVPIHTAQDTIDLLSPGELAFSTEVIAAVLDYLLEEMGT